MTNSLVSVDANFVVTTSVVRLKKRLKSSLQAQIFIYWVYQTKFIAKH